MRDNAAAVERWTMWINDKWTMWTNGRCGLIDEVDKWTM